MTAAPDTEGAMAKTVPVEIRSRWDSSRVLFRADVDATIPLIGRIRAAVQIAVKSRANLSRAYLSEAYLLEANLLEANLLAADRSRADLSGANLSGADLSWADLSRAYLSRADLSRAYLSGAKCRDGVTLKRGPVKETTRTDGYSFLLLDCDVGWRVSAGCRFFTLDEAWRHWGHGPRAGTPLGEESEDILVLFEHQIERETARQGAPA